MHTHPFAAHITPAEGRKESSEVGRADSPRKPGGCVPEAEKLQWVGGIGSILQPDEALASLATQRNG